MAEREQEQSVDCHSAEGLSVGVTAQTGGNIIAPVLSNTTVTGNITFQLSAPEASKPTDTHPQNSGASKPTDTHSQNSDLTSVSLKYKELVKSEYAYVREYNSLPGEHVLLTDHYTELLIIQRHREQSEREKEIRFRGEKFFNARDSEKYSNITVEQFFSPDDRRNIPQAVVLQGNSGNGKSFTALKIMLDWASDKLYAENFDFIFHQKCKEINQISGEKSLVELLRCSQSLTPAQISQILQQSPKRVLFLIDGFDELKLSQDNMSNLSLPTDVQTPASPESTLKALLSGRLLPESFLLVTTRSTATDTLSKLLKKQPQRFTDIMGFSERGVEEYFQRFFNDDQLLQTQAYELVKANETLFTACFIPVICWIMCTVFRDRHNDGKELTNGLDTTTSIYVGFVSTLLEHHCQGLSQSVPSLLRSLGQLAERGMLEQQVLFDQKSVSETVPDPANIPFLCKFLFRKKISQKTMFSFMHLSFQEFFTALYYVLISEKESQMKVTDLLQTLKTSRFINIEMLPLSPVIQFLCGLSNKDVSSSLMESQSLCVSATIQDQIKEWILKFLARGVLSWASHMRTFILHCLYELHEEDFVRKAVKSWETITFSSTPLRKTDCWVLGYCLQFCPHIRKLTLMGCSITPEKLKILQPAVCRTEELELAIENLSDDDVGVLVSALGEGKNLTSLRLWNSVLSDQGVQQILNSLNRQKSVDKLHLTVKTKTPVMITEFIQSKLNIENICVEVEEDSEFSFSSSLSVSASDRVLRLDVQYEKSETSSPQTEPSLEGIRLTCPHTETSNINWKGFFQIICRIKELRKDCQVVDEQLHGLLSILNSVSGLKKVDLYVNSLTESWAARILSLMHTCPSLQDIRVEVYGRSNENLCSSLTVSVTDGDFRWGFRFSERSSPQTEPSLSGISLICPHSETSNINWTTFTQIIYGVNVSRENSPELGLCDQLDALLSFLNSVSGLKKVNLSVIRLTESWAARILSFIQTQSQCPSLQDISFNAGKVWKGFFLEERIRSLQHFQKHPDCTLTVEGWTCTKTSDQCTLNNDCNLKVNLQLHGQSFKLYAEGARRKTSSRQTKPSLSKITLMCLDSEISSINWARFSQIIYGILPYSQNFTEFDEKLDDLLSFLRSVPGLKEVHMTVWTLSMSYAASILSLIRFCPSLQDISFTAGEDGEGLLQEKGLRLLQDSRKRPDCTLTVEGWRCTKPTDKCTKPGQWRQDCNQKVKLLFCGDQHQALDLH